MEIVGREGAERSGSHVHTIDVWFSTRREMWIVERLNADGHLIGAAHHCRDQADAIACIAEWRRAHEETHLVCSLDRSAVAAQRLQPKRRAA